MSKLDLKKLKKQLQNNKKVEQVAKKESYLKQLNDSHNQNIFREAMSGVNPLSIQKSYDKAYHEDNKPTAKRLKHNKGEINLTIHDPLSDELEIEEINSEDILSFCQTGIQKSVFRKLRSGNYRISDELDLHGTTIKQAKQILMYYLQEAVQFEGCCVRIIHGKGHRSNNKPVLKTHVNHWLSEHGRVLAFHSTKPKDGGAGAVYVLLKTQNHKE